MQYVVSDLLAIAGLSREVKWHARGSGYLAVVQQLDSLYAAALRYVDVLAEHAIASGSYGGMAWSASARATYPARIIKQDATALSTGLRDLIAELTNLSDNLDRELANDTDDPVGQQLLAQTAQEFNRQLWLLSSELD